MQNLKVVFICGSLEPGKNGVGDYSSRLSSALAKANQRSFLLAINDPFISSNVGSSDPNQSKTSGTPSLRLSSRTPWRDRRLPIRKFLKSANPDWISLQFVPYSFSKKGLPVTLPSRLLDLSKINPSKWHIMFHELSIDHGLPMNAKSRVISLLQKWIIRKLTHTLHAKLITTHSTEYMKRLLELTNQPVFQLPLFSNIPISTERSGTALSLLGINQECRDQYLLGVLFGNIVKDSMNENAISKFDRIASEHKKSPFLVHIGLMSPAAQNEWDCICKRLPGSYKYRRLGVLDSTRISSILHESDFGITTTPYVLTEKSGSVAAFLEAKKHVWAVNDSVPGVNPKLKGVSLDLRKCLNQSAIQPYTVETVAEQYLTLLNSQSRNTTFE